MSEILAQYSFVPWLRRGLGTKIEEIDVLGATASSGLADERASLEVDLVVEHTSLNNDSTAESTVTKTVSLTGPGDIRGINPRAILRVEPTDKVRHFEPNLLPYIEFYEEDFPWRYTPARPGSDDRKLSPWLALIILQEDEYDGPILNTDAASSITIHADALNKVFYDPEDAWAWAHVQFNQTLDSSNLEAEIDSELQNDPDVGISRIICPRKLQKGTDYAAFLVPTYECGRLGALGADFSGTKAQTFAWQKSGSDIQIAEVSGFPSNSFPFYHCWKFSTGLHGDFESLVSLLRPIVTDPDSGKLPMDIQSSGYDLDEVAKSKTIGFEGALKPPGFAPDVFPNGKKDDTFVEKLTELLNLAVDATDADQSMIVNAAKNPFYNEAYPDDPMVVPPIYGYWHSLIRRLGGDKNDPAWVKELNVDPRRRAAAGLGTKTIQDNQEKLMEEAWQQIGAINEANQKIREAELAKMVGRCIFKKHLKSATDDKFSTLTSRMHRRILDADKSKTVHKEFQTSKIPLAAKSSAFRRVVRPEKKTIRQINANTSISHNIDQKVVSKFNVGGQLTNPTITAAKLKETSLSAVPADEVFSFVQAAKVNYINENTYVIRDMLFLILEQVSLTRLTNSGKIRLKNKFNTAQHSFTDIQQNDPTRWSTIRTEVHRAINQLSNYTKTAGLIEVKLASDIYKEIFTNPSDRTNKTPQKKQYNQVIIYRDLEAGEEGRTGKVTSVSDIQSFQTNLAYFTNSTSGSGQGSVKDKMPMPKLRSPLDNLSSSVDNIREKLDPKTTIEKRVLRSIKIRKNGLLQKINTLKPVMAYPEFEEPVYEELKKISQDFVLPNIEQLPNNSITILETNQAFIESYLTGMNHEMARELQWREFPTDKRGSYFRQFWDIKDNLFEEDSENTKDIKEIHQWQGTLGTHRVDGSGDNLVLVVRGDLLMKYPNTIIYAQKATYSSTPSDPREFSTEISETDTLFPLFSAELEPDVFLFGFELTTEDAKGDRIPVGSTNTSGKNPGWFFVFRERPGQVKFGMDDYTDDQGNADVMPTELPETWSDLSWEHLVSDRAELSNFLIQLTNGNGLSITEASADDPGWGDNAADMASILFQNPVIFARHANEMI